MPDAAENRPCRAAVIGLGRMGAGIARNLDKAGLLAGLYDVDDRAVAASGLGEAAPVRPVPELLGTCDVLLFAVPTTVQVNAALSGLDIPRRRIIIDVTTSSPDLSRRLSADLAARGAVYIDAAMTGGAAGADAGTLTLMAGGEAEAIAACQPVFDAIASRIFHLGPAGAGHAMKLVHNMILHSSFMATCEGLKLAERAGLDVAQAVEVLNAGNARSYVTDTRFPRDILSGTMQARSPISNLEKDLGLAMDFGGDLNARLPYTQLTHSLLATALAGGQVETDFSWLYPLYDGLVQAMEAGR